MKALYKVINTQNVYDLGVRLGDVVDAVKSDDGLFRGTCKGGYLRWDIPVMTFQKYQLEKIASVSEGLPEPAFKAITFASSAVQEPTIPEKPIVTKHGVLLPVYNNEGTAYSVDHPMCPCATPTSPENDLPIPEVPQEAKAVSRLPSMPCRGLDKDKRKYRFTPNVYQDGTLDHYRLMASLPIRLDPALEHAAKKLLFPGQRGAKDELQDLREVIKSVQVYIDYKTAQIERDH